MKKPPAKGGFFVCTGFFLPKSSKIIRFRNFRIPGLRPE